MNRLLQQVREAGAMPVSAASAAIFRIAFGIAMAVNAMLYLPTLVTEYYVDTSFNFPIYPFFFVQPLPGYGVHVVYVGMIVTGLLIAAGLWYRIAITTFFFLTTYIFLLDSSFFQNHEYLISLLSFLMIFLPLNRMWSIDAYRNRALASPTIPAWVVWLLRFQIGVPYFFGGIAKLNADWLRGEPFRMWLQNRTDTILIGPLFNYESVVLFMNYGGLIFDLTIVGFLLYHRSRIPAFVVATMFHLTNAILFGLFIFPWLMIAATTIFFRPEWPLRARAWWLRGRYIQELEQQLGLVRRAREIAVQGSAARMSTLLVCCLALWMVAQVTLPLRHYAIAGNPSWTEQGHKYAWHMRLRSKAGSVEFIVTTPDGETFVEDPLDHLGAKQVQRLPGYPYRLVQFARYLSDLHDGAEVRANTAVSLNGRQAQPIVDPDADLASKSVVNFRRADWILPLEEPLRRD